MLRLTLRTLLQRKLRMAMSGLAIVLGIAFLSGVLVFSHGLGATFDNIVKGSTPDAVVRPASSGGTGANVTPSATTVSLSPHLVEELAALPEVARADGEIAGFGMNLLAKDGTLVGGTGAPTIAFNHSGTPNMDGGQTLRLTSGRWPAAEGELVLDEKAAERGDYRVGDEVGLLAPFGALDRKARLVGTAEFNGGGTAGATLLVFSTPQAQDLFLRGKDAFNQIGLTAADGVSQQELVDAAEQVVPGGFDTLTGNEVAKEQQESFGTFLDVINTFLLVFAVIAVIVGAFIIVNTFTILVTQRTRELALLRALGASRGQVTRSVQLEALVLGVLASSAGIGVGLLLARALAALFRAFGLDISSSALTLTPRAVITSYVVGVLVTLLAAVLPARRAGRVAPLAALRADLAPERRTLGRRAVLGAVFVLLGAVLAAVGVRGAPGADALWVGIGAVLWILTVALLASLIGRPLLLVCRALFTRLFGAAGQLAGENALRDPRRTGATASALMIGLALVCTIGVLAASLNASIDDTVDEEFTADFVVNTADFMPFPTSIGDRLEDVDGIRVLSRQQALGATYEDDLVRVTGVDPAFSEIYDLDVVAGHQDVTGDSAVVFEEFARERRLEVGDRLPLTLRGGHTADLTVAGIVRSSETTTEVTAPLQALADAGIARQDTSISILAAEGADPSVVHDGLDAAAKAVPSVGVFDKAEFADSLRDQVNQLLVIIYALLAFAVVIAVFGIVNTLGLSVFERTREIGLLRAIGMSRPRLRRMITLESVAISVLGAVLGMALGLLIGVLLRQSLADNLTSLGLPLGQLAVFLVVSVLVGVLAAVVPAIRAARLDVLDAIATE